MINGIKKEVHAGILINSIGDDHQFIDELDSLNTDKSHSEDFVGIALPLYRRMKLLIFQLYRVKSGFEILGIE